ncbi:MAG: 3-mercaptopyruvate sulfurtransferase [Caulobacteraceae bacterium]
MSGPLVATSWLAERLGEASLAIIDASWFMPGSGRDPASEYAAGHIPGAVFFGIDEISDHATDLPHMLASPAEFATAARRLGVRRESTLVIYDSHGLFSAPRVWWNFRAMGHEATFILDGGLPRWRAEGRPLERGWPAPPHGDFKSRPNPALVANLADMRHHIETGDVQVVDARAAQRFAGAAPEPRVGLRSGHMPGAYNTPWASFVSGDALADDERLREALAGAGVDLEKPIVTTCGSGVSASLLALALARLGRDDVAVYDGSWSEWGARDDTPIATGQA